MAGMRLGARLMFDDLSRAPNRAAFDLFEDYKLGTQSVQVVRNFGS